MGTRSCAPDGILFRGDGKAQLNAAPLAYRRLHLILSILEVFRECALKIAHQPIALEDEQVLGHLVHEKSGQHSHMMGKETKQIGMFRGGGRGGRGNNPGRGRPSSWRDFKVTTITSPNISFSYKQKFEHNTSNSCAKRAFDQNGLDPQRKYLCMSTSMTQPRDYFWIESYRVRGTPLLEGLPHTTAITCRVRRSPGSLCSR